jgi:hypothetical protein
MHSHSDLKAYSNHFWNFPELCLQLVFSRVSSTILLITGVDVPNGFNLLRHWTPWIQDQPTELLLLV